MKFSILYFCSKCGQIRSLLRFGHIYWWHFLCSDWLGPIVFSPGDSHTKGLLVVLHLGLEGVTKVDTDPKGRFVSFKVTLYNDWILCVYVPSGDSTREQLGRGRFLEGLQNYMKNKNKGNENKLILGDFICIYYV